jgi:hypothetical protein
VSRMNHTYAPPSVSPSSITYEVTGPILETCCPANAARGEPPMQIVLQI